ncbi:hypothetical protein F5141DRAFT_1067203 [Pisolithus sp. B1]|nr:hypothetical protein F5141DRAFT_1067203 [Pisolithus sp. B1]
MTQFSLNMSGVAGVFGGEEAVATMGTVHIYEHRKWLGSHTIAKRYGLLANSRFFSGIFPGIHTDPATLFELDGWKGLKFRAAHSGSIPDETGHLTSLFLKGCSGLRGEEVRGRRTQQIDVTVVDFHHVPDEHMRPERLNTASPLVALIPITVSTGTSVACAYFKGCGVSCLVIGSGKPTLTHPKAADCPLGDGVLGTDREIAALRVLPMVQFVAQLLLVPQGTPFGQSLFLASLAVSWAYNLWLSALDEEKIQRATLMARVLRQSSLKKYPLVWNSFETISQRMCSMEKKKLLFDPPDEDRSTTTSMLTLSQLTRHYSNTAGYSSYSHPG